MTTQYYQRYRMEFDLSRAALPEAQLPAGYVWCAWQPGDEDRHAFVKFQSFRDSIDSEVFESLSDYHGCLRLMREIVRQPGFLPETTWLISVPGESGRPPLDCGTIQGVMLSEQVGGIQNVGVAPDHRGQGLGRALVLKSLAGFRDQGARRIYLEVTSPNVAAVELYRQLGFRHVRTMYRAVVCDELGV
jgi:ribosomal protein S18 acetylase RimI-like enzyme